MAYQRKRWTGLFGNRKDKVINRLGDKAKRVRSSITASATISNSSGISLGWE